VQTNGQVSLKIDVTNNSNAAVSQLAIQLNKNCFGLAPANAQLNFNPPVNPGSKGSTSVPLNVTPSALAPPGASANPGVQAAMKNLTSGSVFYFTANFNLEALFGSNGAQGASEFISMWKGINESKEVNAVVNASSSNIDNVIRYGAKRSTSKRGAKRSRAIFLKTTRFACFN